MGKTDERGREVLFPSTLSKHSEEAEVLGFVGEVHVATVTAAVPMRLLGQLAEVISFEVGHGGAQDCGLKFA